VVGGLPLLVRNATQTHWATFMHLVRADANMAFRQPDHPAVVQAWETLRRISFPAFLGFHDARIGLFEWTWPDGVVPALLCAAALLGAGVSLVSARRAPDGPARVVGLTFVGTAVLMSGILLSTRFGWEREVRYMLTLWPSLGGLYALTCWQLSQSRRWLGPMVCGLLMANQAWWTFGREGAPQVSAWDPTVRLTTTYAPLADRLVSLGRTHLVADYWTAMPLTFESRERVIAVDPTWQRNADMANEVRLDRQSCMIATGGHLADDLIAKHHFRWYDLDDVPGLGDPVIVACPP
jgi:hypothetical protein